MKKNTNKTGLEVAIIGMAGRFPDAKNINEFWGNLSNGVESITFLSDEELNKLGVLPEIYNNPMYVKSAGAIIRDREVFDPGFFGYTSVEAELMDPQMRFFHECVWEALEDAGYDPLTYTKRIGLYAGVGSSFHWEALTMLSGKRDKLGDYASWLLSSQQFVPTRVSYKLNLSGPSVRVDTTCSTSLVAIDMAYRALLMGQCEMALAGGVAISPKAREGYMYQEGLIFSPDGHCRAFDEDAQGTVGGEGVGVIVLKSLNEAIQDGDNIYAVIKGSAINNDGNCKIGYTAPSTIGQTNVIKAALHMAEVESESITYVETHGTGTILGDPIEIEALKKAFDTDQRGYCGIGSVKTNIGHLDAAAGVTGVIKTVLALKNRAIPPSLNFKKPNSKIDFENSPFYVNHTLKKWENDLYPLRAGVSSIGIGGTNAHVIIEESPKLEKSSSGRPYKLLLLSAKSRSALDRLTENLGEYIQHCSETNLADIAYTLQIGRSRFKYCRMLVVADNIEARELLRFSDQQKIQMAVSQDVIQDIVFMFPGQGSQYVNMGLNLYENEAIFRAEMNRCLQLIKDFGYDLEKILFPTDILSEAGELLKQTEVTQPVIFIIEYALAKTLINWGIKPKAMIGHSIGEYVAACLSGVFSLEDALKIVTLRGKLMQSVQTGAMLSVGVSVEELKPLLKEGISIASDNSSSLCVISGETEVIDAFNVYLKNQGIFTKKLHTSHAFHSQTMDGIIDQFTTEMKKIKLQQPQLPFISNLSGTWITAAEAMDPKYWAKHIRETVRFADGLNELFQQENVIFVEVGAGKTLSTFVNKHADKPANHKVINLIRHPMEQVADDYYLTFQIGKLWLWGVELNWKNYYANDKRQRVSLPTYPFDHQKYWIEGSIRDYQQRFQLQERKPQYEWFYYPSWKQTKLTQTTIVGEPGKSKLLIFVNELGLGLRLVNELNQQGCQVILVRPGEQYKKELANNFVINPDKPEDYTQLLVDLKQTNLFPQQIVHLWSVTDNGSQPLDATKIEQYTSLGMYSLMSLAQAIGRTNVDEKIQLKIITNNLFRVIGTESLYPEKNLILGPMMVIPTEYANITAKAIDIIYPANLVEEKNLLNNLLLEISLESEERIISYRGNKRWVQYYEPTQLAKIDSTPDLLQQAGVYLLIGGLGGIGLEIATYLAQSIQAKLVLVNRSQLPEPNLWTEWLENEAEDNPISQKIRKIQQLEMSGAQVLYQNADVSNLSQLEKAISIAERRFGKINGVIHSAGLADGGVIQTRKKDDTDRILAAKVVGTLHLDYLFKDRELDFMILCSSTASMLAPFGQVGYTAANIFLDSYANYRSTQDGRYTISINWDTWKEVGMAVDSEKHFLQEQGRLNQSIKIDGIGNQEGIEVLKRALHYKNSQLVVSIMDLNRRIAKAMKPVIDENIFTDLADSQSTGLKTQRPDITTAYVPPFNNTQQVLAEIWQEHLGIEKVGIFDNFFDLGASSLDIIRIKSKILSIFKKDIPVVALYANTTISALVSYLNKEETEVSFSEEEKERLEQNVTDRKRRLQQRNRNLREGRLDV